MKVIRIPEASSENQSGGIFEGGSVNMKTLIDREQGSHEIKSAIVTFPAGARTKMHTHDHEQLLFILSGKGIVANEHEEHVAVPGMVFLIPAGERHWHGATTDSAFSHLYVYNCGTETNY